MLQSLREPFTFGCLPLLGVLFCVFGLVGGLIDVEALVPIYTIELIFSLTALSFYGFALIFRAIRWLSTSVR